MNNLWNNREADSFGQHYLNQRVYSSRLLGRNPELVLHGGANTSVKGKYKNIFAAPLAFKLGCRLALARKPGKLPAEIISENYKLEYGTNSIEMHTDAININDRVLIVDDLLATGGTANAVGRLVSRLGGDIKCFAFLINLIQLKGDRLLKPHATFSIINY